VAFDVDVRMASTIDKSNTRYVIQLVLDREHVLQNTLRRYTKAYTRLSSACSLLRGVGRHLVTTAVVKGGGGIGGILEAPPCPLLISDTMQAFNSLSMQDRL
jgi:hypothetical protein